MDGLWLISNRAAETHEKHILFSSDAAVDEVATLCFVDHSSVCQHLGLIVVVAEYIQHWSTKYRGYILEVVVGKISATDHEVHIPVIFDQVLRVDPLVYNIAQR
jgi:hypothetical protein